MKGFKNFLMQGDVIVVAIGLVVATAFSTLISAFTDNIINPIVARASGAAPDSQGFGIPLGDSPSTFMNIGALISAIIYFIIFMAVIYFTIVVPYKHVQARRGVEVFGEDPPAQTCPSCLSDDLPVGATRCKYCTSDLPAAA